MSLEAQGVGVIEEVDRHEFRKIMRLGRSSPVAWPVVHSEVIFDFETVGLSRNMIFLT
ncbi:hypothetical protein HMPREF1870_00991 [Bacteroidales bacterium KA00344]|nr:hypothetical protein HMPREF1870_00991 [Bacteroidales bacterium KA00344]